MGCFEGPDGSLILMRNHQCLQGDSFSSPYFPGQPAAEEAYDPDGTGGVTRLVVDARTLELRSSNLVLAGTYWNCAGGHSPWGWLSCEETVDGPHGYVFLCATDADRVRAPQRIAGYGRMRHEAATVHPATNIAYLTEDEVDACFYRFVPAHIDNPFEGKLQALAIKGRPGFDTAALMPGERLPVDWVDIERPEPKDDVVRFEGHDKGAALFRRTEGMWLAGDTVFFCATIGGPIARGQIFRLKLSEPNTLDAIATVTDPEELDMPDNLCVSPLGQLYVAEDGVGGNFIKRVGLDGRSLPFARNAMSAGEFAGPCFAPDGKTLFVNLQREGVTLAITGPFEREPAVIPARATSHGGCGQDWARGARGLAAGLSVIALAALTRRRRARAAAKSG
jgi:secreted PhoX family phosphatase